MEEKKAMVEVEYLKVTPEEEPLGTITKHTGPVEITAPDPEGEKVSQAAQKAIAMRDGALKFTVDSDAEYQTAANGLKRIKDVRKMIKDLLDPMVTSAYEAYKKNLEKRKDVEKPLDEADRHLRNQMATYQNKLEAEHREAEKKAQAEAQEKLRQATEAEAAGKPAEAEIALEEAAQMERTPAPVYIPLAATGTSPTKRWDFEITEPARIPREYLMVDEKKIGAIARSTKNTEKAPIIPGVKFFLKTGIAVR